MAPADFFLYGGPTLTTTAAPFDQAKFEAALHRLLNDVGSVITAASVITGDSSDSTKPSRVRGL